MLYVVYGSDIEKARDKFGALVASLQKKKPDAELFQFDSDNWDAARFEGLLSGQGLFEQKYIVTLVRCLNDEVRDVLKQMHESDNVFLMFEEVLTTKDKKKLEKYAEKIEEHSRTAKKKEEFNVFALTDALGRRDKKKLWVLYQEALRAGKTAEEIHGVLLWQLKTLCAAEKEKTAQGAGLKPFVYSKAQAFLKQFSEGEATLTTERWIDFYHEARLGKGDFNLSLEKAILTL